MITINKRYFTAFLIIFIVELAIALFVRDNFIRPYVGDLLVVLLIYCFLRIFMKPYRFLPLCVFLFAAAVELAQMFNFVDRLGLQDNPVLSIALGSTFDPADLVCYAAGCLLLTVFSEKRRLKRFWKFGRNLRRNS